jgi:hypothetical protein
VYGSRDLLALVRREPWEIGGYLPEIPAAKTFLGTWLDELIVREQERAWLAKYAS